MSNIRVGRNGLRVEDMGTVWRVHSNHNVVNPQTLNYMSRDQRVTGVRYAVGMDIDLGKTRIAYIDYPKDLYTCEELMDGEEHIDTVQRCNVCYAIDQVTRNANSQSAAAKQPQMSDQSQSSIPYQSQVPAARELVVPERLSAGSIASSAAATLPHWLPKLLDVGKSLALRPAGNVAVTFGASVLADVASGLLPPQYQKALHAISDDMADSITPDLLAQAQLDAVSIVDSMYKDGDNLLSKKMLAKSIFKSRDDFKRSAEAAAAKNAPIPNQSSQPSPVSWALPHQSRDLRVPRLFE